MLGIIAYFVVVFMWIYVSIILFLLFAPGAKIKSRGFYSLIFAIAYIITYYNY